MGQPECQVLLMRHLPLHSLVPVLIAVGYLFSFFSFFFFRFSFKDSFGVFLSLDLGFSLPLGILILLLPGVHIDYILFLNQWQAGMRKSISVIHIQTPVAFR